MASDKIAELLNEIGSFLARDTEYPLDGTFLYVEAESMMVDISIFKDLGDHLVFRISMRGLSDVLLELWEAAPADKKWAAMEYRITDGRFDASFIYLGEFDPAEDSLERRDRILQQRYGNKRIVYPSLEES